MIKSLFSVLCWLWLLPMAVPVAAEVAVTVGYADGGRQLRLLFDGEVPEHRWFILHGPTRLVVDLEDTALADGLAQPGPDSVIARVRAAARGDGLRLVVDFDAGRVDAGVPVSASTQDRQLLLEFAVDPGGGQPVAAAKAAKSHFVVAIDAGHGGEDPGARGVLGGQEKDITLAIAKKLAALLNRQPGVRALLVRDGDYFIALRERVNIARKADADLLVSIHADANENLSARGASVYTLSKGGASSEAARWLAEKENSADLLGGVGLEDDDDSLASVLLDLSQSATLENSVALADQVLKSVGRLGHLHKDSVQKAGFIVLKSPDIPSILVETAFISNPDEERDLLDGRHQDKLAAAIFDGVVGYLRQMAPATANIAGLPAADGERR